MLTLGASLTNALKSRATEAVWLLHLYYNDDSAVTPIRLSDVDRKIGGNDYIGIVRSWGSLQQETDIIEFSASTGNVTIILDNTERALLNGRFSDLRLTKNFANRKWEIYLSDAGQISTDPIGSGRISGDIKSDEKQVTLHLLNYESKFDIKIPASVVDSTTYPNAPEVNIGNPFPMSFGDFSVSTAIAHMEVLLVRGRFPAIITDPQDIDAYPDKAGEAMNDLSDLRVYMRAGDNYCGCAIANVAVNAATPIITFNKNFWGMITHVIKGNPTANADGAGSTANAYDLDESTSCNLYSELDGTERIHRFYLNPGNIGVNSNPTDTDIKIYIRFANTYTNVSATTPKIRFRYNQGQDYTVSGWEDDKVAGTDRLCIQFAAEPPEIGAYIEIGLRDTAEDGHFYLGIEETLVWFSVSPLETFIKKVYRDVIPRYTGAVGVALPTSINKVYAGEVTAFEDFIAEYVYFAGKGREFGAWIDTVDGGARATYTGVPDPGYNAAALIENPIYIVESACRTEGGFDENDLDLATFDIAGHSTIGKIENVFVDDCLNIKFAFSQYQFSSLKVFWEHVGKQCGTLFFISGSGKLKAKVRLRPTKYLAGAQEMKIDYDKIRLISWNETPIGDVKNDVTVKYAHDYAIDETIKSVNPTGDATSQGDTLNGYNQTLYLEEIMDCCLDDVTADNYADALLAWHKDRHNILIIESNNPLYQALEISDVIIFSNWPTTLKINGTAIATTDFFMITDITKSGPFKTRMEVMEVS